MRRRVCGYVLIFLITTSIIVFMITIVYIHHLFVCAFRGSPVGLLSRHLDNTTPVILSFICESHPAKPDVISEREPVALWIIPHHAEALGSLFPLHLFAFLCSPFLSRRIVY